MVRNITGVILACVFLIAIQANAQNSVGIGTPTPNSKAVLELVSPGNNQGLLVPRLTTAQRTAASFTATLTTKETGLLVFDSDDQKFYYWQTSQWLPIRSGSDSALTPGNGVTITNGTIAAVPDGDGSSTNELQELELTGNTLKITGSPTSASIDLSALVLTNETQKLQLTGNQLSITGNPSATPITLADNSATNEIQDLQLVGSTLTITNNVGATPINLSAFTGTDTDEQSLSYNTTNGQLSITKLSGPPQTVSITTAGTAGGDLTGTYPNPTIGTDKVTTAAILDGTVSTVDLAANAITTAKILDGTILNADISTVDAAKITTGTLPVARGGSGITAVTPGAIAYGGATNFAFTTVGTTGQILQSNGAAAPTWVTLTSLPPNGTAGGDLTGSYPNPTIGTGKVTGTAILDNTIQNIDIANVDASKVTTGTLPLTVGGTGATTAAGARTSLGLGTLATLSAVSTTEITDGTIVNADISTVDASKITTGTLPVTRGGSGITAVTPGAVAYGGATNFAFTTAGTTGQLLQSNGTGAPTWVNAPTAALSAVLTVGNSAGGAKITNLGTPTVNTDATTKLYVDGLDAADLDKSITNEIQTISKAGTTVTLSGGGGTFTDADVQNLSLTPPTGTNRTVNITNGTGVTFSVADNDNDSGNEIQGLNSVLGNGNNAGGEVAVGFKALSVGTTSTQGALNIDGAHFMAGTPFPSGVEDYNVKDDDYIIFGAPTISKPGNIHLPKASGSRGRVIIVRATGNEGSTSLRIHADDGIDGAASTSLLMSTNGTVYAMTVYSTGATWISISKSHY